MHDLHDAPAGAAVTIQVAIREALEPRWLETKARALLDGPIGTWAEPVLLAGGWYAHVAAGSRPRDIDLFCQDAEHLDRVAARLRERGATDVEDRPPFYRRLAWNGQPIDLAYNVWCRSLDEVFARFDLGLSMVGVRWYEGTAVAQVAPLALASADVGVVFVNLECPNTAYALVTIERAHRYADRLALETDQAGLEWLWSRFERAPAQEGQKMIERYRRVGVQDAAVERRALALLERRGSS